MLYSRGRLLESVGDTTFEYDAKGRRTKKGSTEYYYDGDRLIEEVRSDGTLYFFYDESGVCGMRYNNTNYEFIRNIFGDVVAICNEAGGHVAFYSYDAWGNCTIEINQNNIANINPFRYRGYYYDSESGLYYLMSRSYDPEIGQFISMDTVDYLKPEIIGGVDLYAYCNNNPVMYVDPTGHEWWNPFTWDWSIINDFVTNVVNFIASWNWGFIIDIAVGVLALIGGIFVGMTTGSFWLGLATFVVINNLANIIYYNFISDGKSDLTPTSYHEGYVTRWDRLDLTKQETKESWYNINALRYYGEYNVHMVGWSFAGWSHGKDIPVFSWIARSAKEAQVDGQKWEGGANWWRNIIYLIWGLLGI